MDKGDKDGTEETNDPSSEQGKHFCKICSLDYPTENQFTQHKWSILHHYQMERVYGRGHLHRCLLCDFESYSIGEYSKHMIGDQHKGVLKKRKAKATAVRLAAKRAAELAAKRAAERKAVQRIPRMLSNRPERPQHQKPAGHFNLQPGNPFARTNNWFTPFNANQPMFKSQSQPVNQWHTEYNENSYYYDHGNYRQWQHHGNMTWMGTNMRGNNQMQCYGRNYFGEDRYEPNRYFETSAMRPADHNNEVRPMSVQALGDFTVLPKASTNTTFSENAKSDATSSINSSKDATSLQEVSPDITLSKIVKSCAPLSINSNKDAVTVPKASTNASLSEKAKSDVTLSTKGSKDTTILQKASTTTLSEKAKSDATSSTNGSKTTMFSKKVRKRGRKNIVAKRTQNADNIVLLKTTKFQEISTTVDITALPKDDNNTKVSKNAGNNGVESSNATTNALTKKCEKHSVSEGTGSGNSTSNNIGSSDAKYNSKPNDTQEKLDVVPMVSVPKDVTSKDGLVNIASCHSSGDQKKSDQSTGDINDGMDIDSDTNKRSSLMDALVKQITKSLKPNVGASRSRLHAGIRTPIENTESPLQQKLVQILSSSKSKHTQETEMAKLKKISGLQKRLRKRYGLQLGSSDGQTDDVQDSENNLLENLWACNFTDMKIHEDQELMAQLKAFATGCQQNNSSAVSEDLPVIDFNSTSSSTSSTISTGVCIKQEPNEPLEDFDQYVTKQVYKPTNISEDQLPNMKDLSKKRNQTICDKQKTPHNVAIDSSLCSQQNQMSLFTDVHIKEEQVPNEPLEDFDHRFTKQVYRPTNISEDQLPNMKDLSKKRNQTICDKQKTPHNVAIDSSLCSQQNQMSLFTDVHIKEEQVPNEPLEDFDHHFTKQVYRPTNISEDQLPNMKDLSKKRNQTICDKQKTPHNVAIDSSLCSQQNQMSLFTDVHIKEEQEPNKPLEVFDHYVTKQVHKPTNISKDQPPNMEDLSKKRNQTICDKQKTPHNVAIDSSLFSQQNKLSMFADVHIKEEPLGDDEVVDTTSYFSEFLKASAKHDVEKVVEHVAIKPENVATNEIEILRENINQQAQNATLRAKPDEQWPSLKNGNNSCGTQVDQSGKRMANRKKENGQSQFGREDKSSRYFDGVGLEREDLSEVVMDPEIGIQEDYREKALLQKEDKIKPRRKKDTQKAFKSDAVSSGTLDQTSAKRSKISPAPAVEVGSCGVEERLGPSDQTSAKRSQISPAPAVKVGSCGAEGRPGTSDQTSAKRSRILPIPADKLGSSGEMPTTGMQNNMEKLFDISVREESLHQELKEMEKSIHKLKEVIQKKQMALNNVQSAKQQLDKELKDLRGMRMNILEGARRQGEDMSSLPGFPRVETIPNLKRQNMDDSVEEIIKEKEVDATIKESQAKKPCSTTLKQKKDNLESRLMITDTTGSVTDTTQYPPAIVLSTGNQNIDMQNVLSLLANPAILQQIQQNFRQLKQVPTEPDKEALIVTIPESESASDIAEEDHAMEEDPVVVETKETWNLRTKRKLNPGNKDNVETSLKRESKRIKTIAERASKIVPKNTLIETPESSTKTTSKKKSGNTADIDPEAHTCLSKKPSRKKLKQVGKKSEKKSVESSEEQEESTERLWVKPSYIKRPSKKRSNKSPKKQTKTSSQLDTEETSEGSSGGPSEKEAGDQTSILSRKLDCSPNLCEISDDKTTNGTILPLKHPTHMRFIDCEEGLLNMQVMDDILYCICKDNAVRAYSLESCQLEGTYTAINAKILSMALVKTKLFVSYADQKFCEFDLKTQKCVYEYHCSSDVMCMHSNWNLLYIGMLNGIVAVVKSKTRELITKHKGNSLVSYMTSMVQNKAKVLIVASPAVSIINESTGDVLAILRENIKADVIYMNVVGERLYTADKTGLLYVNNVYNGERIKITCLDSSFTSLQVVNQSIISANKYRNTIKVSDTKKLQVHLEFCIEGEPLQCALVHQQTMVIGGQHGLICLYDPCDHFLSTAIFQCMWSTCSKVANSHGELIRHSVTFHCKNINLPQVSDYTCNWGYCKVKCGQKNALRKHLKTHIRGFKKKRMFVLKKT